MQSCFVLWLQCSGKSSLKLRTLVEHGLPDGQSRSPDAAGEITSFNGCCGCAAMPCLVIKAGAKDVCALHL